MRRGITAVPTWRRIEIPHTIQHFVGLTILVNRRAISDIDTIVINTLEYIRIRCVVISIVGCCLGPRTACGCRVGVEKCSDKQQATQNGATRERGIASLPFYATWRVTKCYRAVSRCQAPQIASSDVASPGRQMSRYRPSSGHQAAMHAYSRPTLAAGTTVQHPRSAPRAPRTASLPGLSSVPEVRLR
jgi:hypothetical protein